jgi:hypothetical protein
MVSAKWGSVERYSETAGGYISLIGKDLLTKNPRLLIVLAAETSMIGVRTSVDSDATSG